MYRRFIPVLICSLLTTSAVLAQIAPLPELRSCQISDSDQAGNVNVGSWLCEKQYFGNRNDIDTLIDLAILSFVEEKTLLAPSPELRGSLESLELIRRAIDENPNIARAFIVQSDILTWMGLLDEALESLGYAIQIDEDDIAVTIRHAALLFELREYEEVLWAIDLSPHAESDDPALLRIRAAALREVGDDDGALALYEELLGRGQVSMLANLHIAEHAAQQADTETALDLYSKALKLAGEGGDNFGLGFGTREYPALQELLLGQTTSVAEVDDLCAAFEQSPNNARIAMRIANVLSNYAETDKEFEDRYILALRMAIELATEDDVDVLVAAAGALYDQGQYGLAALTFSESVFLIRDDLVQDDVNQRKAVEAAAVAGAIKSIERLGVNRSAAKQYLADYDLAWDELLDYGAVDVRMTLQVTFAGPRFEDALSKFYAYWQGVDFSSLEMTVGIASPCALQKDRFEQVIRKYNVLFGRYVDEYRSEVHPRIRHQFQLAGLKRLGAVESKLRLLSSDETFAELSPIEVVATIDEAIAAHSVLETIPLIGVYAIPDLVIGVVSVPYNVPKEQFPGEFDPAFCQSVWLTATVKDCLVRIRNSSYLVRAQGIVLNLSIDSKEGEQQYSELLEWIDSNRHDWQYKMTAHLRGTFFRTSHDDDTPETHGLKEKGGDNMHEFEHDHEAVGCDQYDMKAMLNNMDLEEYVQSYYEVINLTSLDDSIPVGNRGVAIIDHFPDPSVNTYSYRARIKDKHFEFGGTVDPEQVICVGLPRRPAASEDDSDNDDDKFFDEAHGIYVTGILGAQKNQKGLVGIAYDSNIFPYSPKAGTTLGASDVIDIINDLGGQGEVPEVSVLNGSFEFKEAPEGDLVLDFYDSFLTHLDHILFVFAAGNSGTTTDLACNNYPACYSNYPNVMSVAPLIQSNEGELAIRKESDYGRGISIAAPGTRILTTDLNHHFVLQDGSSMAAPFVSGAAYTLSRKAPNLKAYQVKQRLVATADFLEPPSSPGVRHRDVQSGILNVGRAIEDIYDDVVIYREFDEFGNLIGGPRKRAGKLAPLGDFSELKFYAKSTLSSGVVECSNDDLLRLHRNGTTFNVVCKETYEGPDDTLVGMGVIVKKDKHMVPDVADLEDRPNKCFDYSNDTAKCFTLTTVDKDDGTTRVYEIDLWKIDDIYFGFDE